MVHGARVIRKVLETMTFLAKTVDVVVVVVLPLAHQMFLITDKRGQ